MCVDWDKPLQLKSGESVRFLGRLNNKDPFELPVAVAIMFGEEEWLARCGLDGKDCTRTTDIINVPQEKWINVYPAKTGDYLYHSGRMSHSSYEFARAWSAKDCVATVKIS